jgi:hexosaminidase
MPKEFVKKYIDYLAMYKFNTFHWHLTDDQGWRIEIKKYPKLTEIGAWRKETLIGHFRDRPHKFDGKQHGGFYTQEEIEEIVNYAKSRYITVVPEIEMPGHAGAALASYPELSCTGGPFEVMTKWGINEEVYCAGNEKTFEFLKGVLSEVIELFPSEYIHIGGDECPKVRWEECFKCQARIKGENLKNEDELQSYFIKRIEKFLNSKGRKLIGWDEILEGGLAPDATVMSWRGMVGGIEASKAGHDVVMAPYSHVYFDYYQGNPELEPLAIGGYLPLKKVYSFEPTPEELTPEEAKHILGAQANVWTEYIKTPEHFEYMVFPRIAAISEVVWTPEELKSWDDFILRVEKQFKRYELLGINYAKSIYNVNIASTVDTLNKELMINLDAEAYQPIIYYTLDGREPTAKSNLFKEPFILNKTSTIKAGVFKEGKLLGKISSQEFLIHRAIGGKIDYKYPYNERYTGGGDFALLDGVRGNKNISGTHWQSFEGDDLEVVIDLGEILTINKISVGFLQAINSWIFFPESVVYELSNNGKIFEAIGFIKNDIPTNKGGVILKDFTLELPETKARFIKIKAKNIGTCPDWHRGAGDKAWLFSDEIIVE